LHPVIFAVPKLQTQATKKLTMPKPASDSATKLVRHVPWDLFKHETPAVSDVEQSGRLSNCPLAALLSALAHTPKGRAHIKSLVTQVSAIVETDVSGVASELDSTPPGNKITTPYYFTVQLGGKAIEVSSVFYTDDADAGWDLIYMTSPNQALWPGVIEKAYAVKEGGYGALDSGSGKGLTLNEIWKVVVGSTADGFAVNTQTHEAQIRAAVTAARTRPTVAASDAAWHGFAVLGMRDARIELYDPMKPGREMVSMADFRTKFSALLYGSP
jgi:hypothetical protein